jgi:hypothetical protein
MPDIEGILKAIREEGLSGWLFYNIWHRDEIADTLLEVPRSRSNSRPWVCLLAPGRAPLKIVHRIEASILDHLPGESILYHTRQEFLDALGRGMPRTAALAVNYSTGIPVGSFLDHGTALLLQSFGAALVPSEALVARCMGALDAEGRRTHDAAARVLYASVADAWSRIAAAFREGRRVTEGQARDWILTALADAGLESDSPPIVGAGRHTADPHFSVPAGGAALEQGDVVQFDLWAKGKSPGAVYADISWVGVCAPAPSAEQERLFDAVLQAREAALSLLQRRLTDGTRVSGADVDRAARDPLVRAGFEPFIRHRTGHSIGHRVHGFGVNLDSVEFPDERALAEGALFSIEPGLYREDFGMRTEIDCLIHEGKAVVTGGQRQTVLLALR